MLAVAMMMCLCACGGQDQNPQPDSTPNDNTQATTTGADTEQTQPTEKVEETPKAEVLAVGKSYSVADYADFTLFKIETAEKLAGSMGSSISYKPADGNVYVDMVLDITNTGTTAVSTDDIVVLTGSTAAGTQYAQVTYAIETDNGTRISTYDNIAPLAKARLHCGLSVPKTETAVSLTLSVNGTLYTYEYTLGVLENNAIALTVGAPVEVADYATMVFKGTEYTDDLLPSNTSGWYTHYEVDDPTSNTYLVAKFDVTNYQSSAKDCDTFVSVKATYMDKYTYTGFVVMEDTDGEGFSSYGSIDPLATRHLFFLIEVPKSVSSNPAALTIVFGGQEYSFTA